MRFWVFILGVLILLLIVSGIIPALAEDPEIITLTLPVYEEASSVFTSRLVDNTVEESNTNSSAFIDNSFQDGSGLFNLNQAPGSLNNQSNIALITFTPENSLSDIQLDILSECTGNTVRYSGASYKECVIENSFDNARGAYMVNQSAGNLNQQDNIFVFAFDGALVLRDIELAAVISDNVVEYSPEADVERRDVLENSFSDSTALVIINQSSGDLNTIANTFGLSFSREIVR
jgi:hypothetical protein